MKNLSRIVAVATLSALAVTAPTSAFAKPGNPHGGHGGGKGASANVKDAKGDVYAPAGSSAAMAKAADIKQVQVKAKKGAVQVIVRGAFEAPETNGVGTSIGIALNAENAAPVSAMLQTAPGEVSASTGFSSDCAGATGVADFARGRVTFTVPQTCLVGFSSTSVSTGVDTWMLDAPETLASDSLDRQPTVRLAKPDKPGKGTDDDAPETGDDSGTDDTPETGDDSGKGGKGHDDSDKPGKGHDDNKPGKGGKRTR